MVTRIELFLLIGLSACSPDLEIMIEREDLGVAGGFVCGDNSEHTYNDSTERALIRGCLGLQCGPETPDSATCYDTAVNRAYGSCVSAFFSCFAPAGACTEGATPGTASFANGAKITITEDELSAGGMSLSLVPAGANEPCVTQLQNRVGYGAAGTYWAREAD